VSSRWGDEWKFDQCQRVEPYSWLGIGRVHDLELVERADIRTLLHTICTLRNTLAHAAWADASTDL
jgi:hypothetical protein